MVQLSYQSNAPTMLVTSGGVSESEFAMANHTTKQCLVCGKEFVVKSRSPRQRMCSHSCGRRFNIKIPSPLHQPETDTYLIPLTKGYNAIVDACDIDLAAFKWTASVSRTGPVYAMRQFIRDGKQENDSIHRAVLSRVIGRLLLRNEYVDHINGDGLLNTRANLRLATKAQNAANQKVRSDNASGYKGVSWSKVSQKWRARIKVGGREFGLGLFATAELAHAAYVVAAIKYQGEYASDGRRELKP